MSKIKSYNYFQYLIEKIFSYVVLSFATIFIVFPFFWMIINSLKPAEQLMLSPPVWIPSKLEIFNYIRVWSTLPLVKYMKNSIIIAFFTCTICLVISTMAAYSLSRFRTKIRTISIGLFLFTQLIPFMLPFVAFYFLMFKIGLTNTYAGLVIAYSIWALPFCTLMMRSYFTSAIPPSLEESAIIDGCSKFGAFIKIALPLVKPGLVATAIFAFILSWNDFIWASVMLVDNDLKPVSVGIYDYVGRYGANVSISMTMATAVLITLPTMILFGFLQKHLVSGLSAGAIKG